MIDWKQRLYAFLLRRVLGPLLDESSAPKLHDSIDVSLQEGKFVLKNVALDCNYLTEKLSEKCPGLSVRVCSVDRLEINLALKENDYENDSEKTTQSSLAWRAMKLGSFQESLPAVSLLAECKIDGIHLELETVAFDARRPIDYSPNASPGMAVDARSKASAEETENESQTTSKSIIGSYIDSALATLRLKLDFTDIHIKFFHQQKREAWISVKVSSFSYNDVDTKPTADQHSKTTNRTIVNKAIEFSSIIVEAGEGENGEKESASVFSCATDTKVCRSTTVALAEGTGHVFLRVIDCRSSPPQHTTNGGESKENSYLRRDIDVRLNHQFNFSLGNRSLRVIHEVILGFNDVTEANTEGGEASQFQQTSATNNPLFESADRDREDLKALTGIMRQYKEAYHMAEKNQLKGGILVPSNAYIDDGAYIEDLDGDQETFDMFFDANDQSFYNATSMLMKSTHPQENSGEFMAVADHIHTKVQISLLSACVKLNFREFETDHQYPSGEEYILATMNDFSLSLSSTQRSDKMLMDISHFQIEDAHFTNSSTDMSSTYGRAVEIGSMLSWVEDDVQEESNLVVSGAPCVSVEWQKIRTPKGDETMQCNVTLLPLELCFRLRTVANLSMFFNTAQMEYGNSIRSTIRRDVPLKEDAKENGNEMVFQCDCPSINLSFPTSEGIDTAPMFERCGEIAGGRVTTESSIGLTFESTGFEFHSRQTQGESSDEPYTSGKFWCRHMGMFAVAPDANGRGYEIQMLRKDIFTASGRLEVNPSIPISFAFQKITPEGKGNYGRESFPIVPAISSFKARQEDDDDDDEEGIERRQSRFATQNRKKSDARKDIKAPDPQIGMLANAEKSDVILTTIVPEFIVNMTTNELETLLRMLHSMQPSTSKEIQDVEQSASREASKPAQKLSIAVNVDKVSISIQEDSPAVTSTQHGTQTCAFLVAMDCIRAHTFIWGSEMKHFRIFSQDFCFYTMQCTEASYSSPINGRKKTVEDRFNMVKNLMRAYSKMSVTPVLFRSRLFTPISQETPSFLVDLIDLSTSARETENLLKQRRIHLTFYHLTYRYDVDSDWIERLATMLSMPKNKTMESPNADAEPFSDVSAKDFSESTMTRVFVSCADINMDYRSPSYFSTESETIIRIGDLRLSSNIMTPAGLRQSFNVSIGDFTYHISGNMRANRYEDENKSLCRYSLITKGGTNHRGKKSPLFGTMPEAILRELSFVNVLSLDSMDAVVTKRNQSMVPFKNNSGHLQDLPVDISLSLGTLSIHACKDSFACFANSVGELQSKLTALTDADIATMKDSSATKRSTHLVTGTQMNENDTSELGSTLQNSFSEIKIPTIEQNDSDTLLLDGHEWTTIDKDPLPGLVIPPGDEQTSGWYSSSEDFTSRILGSDQIISQHFPLHTIADPLAEGDMGASELVGKFSNISLKSRLSIRKLNVKIRFFDGYDWPENCSNQEKEAVKRLGKNFVIEPLPRSTVREKEGEKKPPGSGSAVTRKAALMGELLDTTDDMFEEVPLPEDRVSVLNREKQIRISKRRPNTFFQVSLNGVALRMDSYEHSEENLLQSILEVTVSSLFIAETVSGSKPLKMIGEWTNDNEHPRDTRHGTIMLRMVTWAPETKITSDDNIASDECSVTMQLMPMRCLLDQRAISFAKAFFLHEDEEGADSEFGNARWSEGLHFLPPPFFRSFKIKPWKVKVDYYPTRIDVTALREGCIVELVNLSPIQRMVITLNEVVVGDSLGFGPVMDETVSKWIQEICATQLHKFLANARPFEPFTDVGQGLTDLVILPYEAFKQGDSVQRAMKRGVKSLAETVVFQTLATTSGLTQIAAGLMAESLGGPSHHSKHSHNDSNHYPLPSRPNSIPKGIGDARLHAAKSLSRGLNAANYKVVVVPYREYLRNGVTGALTSVIKGIPVLLVAPLTGATEAASYTLLGARNALRPDLRREEEASNMI